MDRDSIKKLEELTFSLPHIDTAPPRIVEKFLSFRALNGGVNLFLSDEVRVSRCQLRTGQSIFATRDGLKEVYIVYRGEVAVHSWGDAARRFKEGCLFECDSQKTWRIEAVTPASILRVTIFQQECQIDAPGNG